MQLEVRISCTLKTFSHSAARDPATQLPWAWAGVARGTEIIAAATDITMASRAARPVRRGVRMFQPFVSPVPGEPARRLSTAGISRAYPFPRR
ncbi:hypothetical protein GCM10012284_55240 [Mangrovihabitans endophyticus]|uniref:Uncharacterized protein n=1 Tax=Mangrovihabitans endophyticus TaxID=1751298 RepID=A0A8J3C5S9_9ACTN|nr:hypothetical protein GCM10012284_55240 [Mangrovihabitans endophyticus]